MRFCYNLLEFFYVFCFFMSSIENQLIWICVNFIRQRSLRENASNNSKVIELIDPDTDFMTLLAILALF